MIPSPADYEIIDAHTHPFLDFAASSIAPYGKPETMAEFDYEMHKVGIDRYAGAPLVKKKISDFKDIIDKMLCPPAAAISIALLASACPFTSEKSMG